MKVTFNGSSNTTHQYKGKTYYGGQVVDVDEKDLSGLERNLVGVKGNNLKVTKKIKVKDKKVKLSKEELFGLKKFEQVTLLIGYGIEKRDIPKLELDRVNLLLLKQ